jgi:hypothetical protein
VNTLAQSLEKTRLHYQAETGKTLHDITYEIGWSLPKLYEVEKRGLSKESTNTLKDVAKFCNYFNVNIIELDGWEEFIQQCAI